MSSKYQGDVTELPAEMTCNQTIWLEYAHWLVHSGSLSGGTAVEYMRKTLAVVRQKHGHLREHEEFFREIDAESRCHC